MIQWLCIAVVLYIAAILIAEVNAGSPVPPSWIPIQTALWKLGNVTLAAFVGYWIDRRAFHQERLNAMSPPLHGVRRAIVMGAAMLAVALGL